MAHPHLDHTNIVQQSMPVNAQCPSAQVQSEQRFRDGYVQAVGICVEQLLANAAYVVGGLEDMKTCLEQWFQLPSPPTIRNRYDLGCMFGVDKKLVPFY